MGETIVQALRDPAQENSGESHTANEEHKNKQPDTDYLIVVQRVLLHERLNKFFWTNVVESLLKQKPTILNKHYQRK